MAWSYASMIINNHGSILFSSSPVDSRLTPDATPCTQKPGPTPKENYRNSFFIGLHNLKCIAKNRSKKGWCKTGSVPRTQQIEFYTRTGCYLGVILGPFWGHLGASSLLLISPFSPLTSFSHLISCYGCHPCILNLFVAIWAQGEFDHVQLNLYVTNLAQGHFGPSWAIFGPL